MIINQYFQELRKRFSRETNAISVLDIRLILQAITGLSDENFITEGETPLSSQQIERIDEFISRRLEGEPVSRLLGRREFWGRSYEVTPATLDPRPDTETLVQKALERGAAVWGADPAITVADIGTGTGCILISLLAAWPRATGVAVDVSPDALAVARRNAARHGVADRISFIQASYLSALGDDSIDLLVSNPPYIPNRDIPNLARDVRNYDPILALSGGEDGLEAYKILISESKKRLRCGGFALYEIGCGQLPEVTRLVDDSGATLASVTPDLSGVPRVVEISHGDNKKNL